MNIFDFNDRFSDEHDCEVYLRQKREEEGLVCEKCHQNKFYWLGTRKLWKCRNCSKSINLTAGTMMEKSKVPLLSWFKVIHMMTSTKKAFSALEIQRQTGEKYYESVWYMMQKIRIAMGKRDAKYRLQGNIEIDDGYFEVVNDKNVSKNELLKAGGGSIRQAKVLVMVESRPNPKQQNPNKKKRILGFVKMIVVDDTKAISITYEVEKAISPTSLVITDGYSGYVGLKEIVKEHKAIVVPKKESHIHLPWVNTVIANAKRQLLGVHHSIHRQFLQNYLNEFCYKLNRRTFKNDLFDRLIVAGINDTWY